MFSKYPTLRFVKIMRGTKRPFEKDWVNKPYTWEETQEHIKANQNYGVQCGYGGLIVIDSDTQELQEAVEKDLPETFRVRTGSGGCHDYYFCEELKKKLVLTTDKHYGEVQSFGTQVIGPGSLHPNGKDYEVEKDLEIATITIQELTNAIKQFMPEVKAKEDRAQREIGDYGESDINNLSIDSVMSCSGFQDRGNGEMYGENPWHGSSTGMNTWINPGKNVAFCFRCNAGINVAKAVALNEGIIHNCSDDLSKEDFKKVLDAAHEKYGLKKPEKAGLIFTDTQAQADAYLGRNPIFYDKSGMFWMWDDISKCWGVTDETDILNVIQRETGVNIVESKKRTEILNSMKQEGRKRIPKPMEDTWVQFHDTIVDVKTGEQFPASPEFYITNPVPWRLHPENFSDTPNMDRIFAEWVGEEWVKTLYQILAYSLLPDYPIQRMFCFHGGGSNGKSCYLQLLKKFVGGKNCCATELDVLLKSRFEITRLHKKLVCLMGETNFGEMNRTAVLKRLTGNDLIGMEYKNKNHFEDKNYAKIIIATNNIPTTTDKTDGFYRRWMIIDFPNQFSEKKDILAEIPLEEYEALAVKCIGLLKDLLDNRGFDKEGSIEERKKRFEERSNPLSKFIADNVRDHQDLAMYISKAEFSKRLNEWLKENNFRAMGDVTISSMMKKEGYEEGKKYMNWMFDGKGGQMRVWYGIQWK